MSSEVKTLKVTLVKSTIGYNAKQRRIAQSLGLRRLQSSVIVDDTPTTRGMINKISHLLRVEEVSNS
ncbi:MAG: 50S ribosomal protein L30 [Chloroflexi bacterium]|nr:50S ribosomal protein L30 [Chloroflexota bacterium]